MPEGEGAVPAEGEGAVPAKIAAEPEEAAPAAAAPEAAAPEAAATEAAAAAEMAEAEEAEAEAKAEAEAARAEAEAEDEEELVFLALAPSQAPGKASTSKLPNDKETRARVRTLTTASCSNGRRMHARPQHACAHHGALTLPLPHRCTRSSSRWTRMGAATCHVRSSPPNCALTVSSRNPRNPRNPRRSSRRPTNVALTTAPLNALGLRTPPPTPGSPSAHHGAPHGLPPSLVSTGELEALLGLPDAMTIPQVVRLMRYLEQTGE